MKQTRLAIPLTIILIGTSLYLYMVNPIQFSKLTGTKPVNIKAHCTSFTKEECEGYLGRDAISAGYKALKINIENHTENYLQFSSQGISLKTVPANVVAKKVYRNTSGRIAGWGIGGLIMPLVWIPGIVHSASAYKNNKKTSENFALKALADRVIAPNSNIEGVIFTKINDYKDTFDIVLTDINSQEKIVLKVA